MNAMPAMASILLLQVQHLYEGFWDTEEGNKIKF
jgi:hypothetical protein